MEVKTQPPFAQRHEMIARPARRQRGPQRGGMRRQLGKWRMRLCHHFGIQRKGLKRDEIDMTVRMTRHQRHHSQQVQPGAKAGLRDGQMTGL